MKKYILTFVLCLIADSASAALFDVKTKDIADFIKECKPYEETISKKAFGNKLEVINEVMGKKNGYCELKITIKEPRELKVANCTLLDDDLEKISLALEKDEPTSDLFENFEKTGFCRVNTLNLFYDNLANCKPFANDVRVSMFGMEIDDNIEIVGFDNNNKCIYKRKSGPKQSYQLTQCAFSKEQLDELKKFVNDNNVVKTKVETDDRVMVFEGTPFEALLETYLNDANVCSDNHYEYSEIADKISTCAAFEGVSTFDFVVKAEFNHTLEKKDANNCLYTQKAMVDDSEIVINCNFSIAEQKEFANFVNNPQKADELLEKYVLDKNICSKEINSEFAKNFATCTSFAKEDNYVENGQIKSYEIVGFSGENCVYNIKVDSASFNKTTRCEVYPQLQKEMISQMQSEMKPEKILEKYKNNKTICYDVIKSELADNFVLCTHYKTDAKVGYKVDDNRFETANGALEIVGISEDKHCEYNIYVNNNLRNVCRVNEDKYLKIVEELKKSETPEKVLLQYIDNPDVCTLVYY